MEMVVPDRAEGEVSAKQPPATSFLLEFSEQWVSILEQKFGQAAAAAGTTLQRCKCRADVVDANGYRVKLFFRCKDDMPGQGQFPLKVTLPAQADKPPRTRVFFRWVCHARIDEEVRVVGSCKSLGDWQPENGHVLAKSERSPCWTSSGGVLLPLGVAVEYRYAVCRRGTGELLRWEPQSQKRTVVPTGTRHVLEDDDGRYRLEDEAEGLASSPRQAPAPGAAAGSGQASPGVPLPQEPGPKDRVLLVFRTLPVRVRPSEDAAGWEVTGLSDNTGAVLQMLRHLTKPDADVHDSFKVWFVGNPGVYVKEEGQRKQLTELLAAHQCIPVFVDQGVAEQHISFCEDFLWPVFHNVKIFDTHLEAGAPPGTLTSEAFDKAKWKSFQSLNNAYAETIEASVTAETLVWIHDYELLLVPRYLYLRCPDLAIGLFLHCAFPSSEVLRCLVNREEILQSMLSSRLVTFQIFDYMRNFISCCSELLGASHSFQKGGILQVEHENKSVVVAADHFALPYRQMVTRLAQDSVQAFARSVRGRYKGKTIIGSIDRCDCFAGLALKLRIFHRFLLEYQQYQGRVVLVQYVSTFADGRGAETAAALFKELEQMAAETNRAFGTPGEPPVVSICVEEMDRDKRLAAMLATDVLLDTSINDGLNLVPFVFYAAHSVDLKGVAIVSEFCGCSSVLTGVFKVNPWHSNAVLTALDQALCLPAAQQEARFARDHSYVSTQTTAGWVTRILTELKALQCTSGPGLGAGFKGHFNQSGFRHLDFKEVLDAYRKAKSRVLFLDNEGTIAAKAGWSIQAGGMALKREGQPPDPQVLDCLQSLVNDRGNTVVVASGRGPQSLDQWFGAVDGLGLCAEHGFYQVLPRSLQQRAASAAGAGQREQEQPQPQQERWRAVTDSKDEDEWKAIVFELMKQYVRRVQGSIVECKGSGISWNYRLAVAGAVSTVNDLALQLERFLNPADPQGLLHGYPVKVTRGKGYVEVNRSDVDKGTAVMQLLNEVQNTLQPVDFVLCIGDDRSDEEVFEAVGKFFETRLHTVSSSESALATPAVLRKPGNSYSSLASLDSDLLSPTSPKPSPNSSSGGNMLMVPGQHQERSPSPSPSPTSGGMSRPFCFTVTVGRKPSKATYFVGDVGEVSELLNKLASQAIVSSFSRFASMPSLNDCALQLVEEEADEEPPVAARRSDRRSETTAVVRGMLSRASAKD